MASTIKIKNSSTASAVPASSDLVQGELAINVTDKRIFTENASGTVVELGTNPSSISATGLVTAAKGSSNGITIGDVSTNSNSVLRMQGTSAGKNWQIANNLNVSGIEFTPSTANGGTTFTTPAVVIDSSGNLLVGKTSASGTSGVGTFIQPDSRISAVTSQTTNSFSTYELYSTGAGAYRFYVGAGGTIFATSIVISAISDQRLKENVRDLDTGLDSIMALKPRRFDWKEGKGQDKKDVAGFIAQEFETVFPECVNTTKAGGDGIEYKNINHETLIPTLVKAIQEQQAQISSQAAVITTLTERITALEQA